MRLTLSRTSTSRQRASQTAREPEAGWEFSGVAVAELSAVEVRFYPNALGSDDLSSEL